MSMGLTSGKDAAHAMGREPLMGDQLRVGKATNQEEFDKLSILKDVNSELREKVILAI
jgi:hypothetical protein